MKSMRTEQHQINKNHELFDLCDKLSYQSKNLYNRINYILRQRFTKSENSDGEEFTATFTKLNKGKIRQLDEFKELGSDMAEGILHQLCKDWKSFFKANKDYNKNPHKYKKRPRLPGYAPSGEIGRKTVFNRKATVKTNGIKVPLHDVFLEPQTSNKVKQFRIKPSHNQVDRLTHYTIEIVYEIEVPEPIEEHNRIAGIDLGVDRLATIATNIEGLQPICINGKPVKNMNQYFNKKRAKLMSYIGDRGTSNRIRKLTRKRNNKIKNYFHNASRKIVDWCVENQIDTIVIGKNKGWKDEVNIGKVNNQNFVSIPFNMLIQQIKYKAEEYGIVTIEQEESYTSSASMLDKDDIPVYKKGEKKKYEFSGYKRAKNSRGLYKSYEHGIIHRDVNAAYNIIRKKFGDIFDYEVERHPKVVNL